MFLVGGTHPNPRGYLYAAATWGHTRNPPRGPYPAPAWHLVRTYPEAWLAPYLGAHLSCTCLTPSLGLSYPWLTPDLDVAGT